MTPFVQVVTTTDSAEAAQEIARDLVQQNLAACVQVVGPVLSVYRWQGNVETGSEWQCIVKTRQELYPRVEAAIRARHSYEVPEILAMPVVAGSQDYLDWMQQQTKS